MDQIGDNLPVTQSREIIGCSVSLPGRFDILTDGVQFPLNQDPEMFQAQRDREHADKIDSMIRRMVSHARRTLDAEGRNLNDCMVTVTVAVHHKGQATDFWVGDSPDRKKVDKSLPEHLTKPDGGKRIEVKR